MKRNEKIAEKRLEQRRRIFPHITDADLWRRQTSKGFTTIPRGLPLVMMLMDRLSKGKPVSATYFELWCRMFDESFLHLKPREMAFYSGFSGQRAEQTWTERMRILQRLGFIKIQPGAEGEMSYAVVLNPYTIIKNHFEKKTPGLDAAAYNALLQRAVEIGAKDLDDVPPQDSVVVVSDEPRFVPRKPARPPLPPGFSKFPNPAPSKARS
jgi:hypothetical protein